MHQISQRNLFVTRLVNGVTGRGVLTLLVAASAVTACGDQRLPAEPAFWGLAPSTSESQPCKPGDEYTGIPCYELPGVVVSVPSRPAPFLPPPAPPMPAAPVYTPSETGWGTPSYLNPNRPFDVNDIIIPEIEGEYAAGPLPLLVCMAARAGVAGYIPTLQAYYATQHWAATIRRLHDAEVQFQMVLANSRDDQYIMVFQIQRDQAQYAYNDGRESVRQHLGISVAAMGAAAASCILKVWIPWL